MRVFVVFSRKWGTVEIVGVYQELEKAAYAAVIEETTTMRVCTIKEAELGRIDREGEAAMKGLIDEEEIENRIQEHME